MKFDDFDDNATKWLCILIYLYIYMLLHNDLMRGHMDLVMLRSTTGSYGRPMLEVVYGETLFSLHWDCIGVDSSGRVVGVSAWCIAHVDIPGSTLVWTQCITFWFSIYKLMYICVLFSKSICSIKENNICGLWPCLDPIRFREWFQSTMNFKWKTKNHIHFLEYLYLFYDLL